MTLTETFLLCSVPHCTYHYAWQNAVPLVQLYNIAARLTNCAA